ncbi:UDP-N-acetylmuramoylalanyl-D-glutamate--2,6-diaminopimelate ligase [Bacillus glycinifermentans]|uniref:UDP-N-acetylmuramoyl-L-alanyl-D-glutamate--2,6-diaminopimelate ligase n=1 Tax=Bacillus glycinifermentans TaxID=1664069 RepID=A0A0J6HRU3_9BACI|nr:UDP-N-acetylmuramoyl-L-alanyl-D-glutamate--2,6-diaminopimelate ligase [Bacillus glycinifermentans]ATH91323.1 UDP-N-acetylmuramoyl-L-alanyl-D-glutamate--2,6-diaminopimelate ligase [Bacillus glycinifermentans]KMM55160.1 UDP-N-acetylmuramoylalanyl-D-glutamate--2,6-diaminopimelate ligase [Bacillus glycinifermentans]KRT93396.1 UDP-N-acetylmuramoylalanyl-D-glutamate--2,6-diaminopimelate ligase [Bacillus glycinifermentans]MEC0485370.1 UDP-N-acetylmuramoyl-L-alanyl-D-glutamate--2,6-diaminopimelate l
MKLTKLLTYLKNEPSYKGQEDPDITSIEMDSREVKTGSLFVCIKGYTVDGHDYVRQAADKGAAAIVAERQVDADVPVIIVRQSKRALAVLSDAFYGQPTKRLRLVGITGTNGKTSTSHMAEEIFRKAGCKTGLIGTMYTKINDETFDVKNTTPESVTLQKTFKKMVDREVDTAIMEVSSHALHMGRVHGCDYDIAAFTNLTQDHLDYHQTMDEYKHAKSLLFSQLGGSFNHERPKWAVLNADDPASEYFAQVTSAHLLTYGISNRADIMADNIEMAPKGTTFDLVTPKGTERVTIPLVGLFNVYNVLTAAAIGFAADIPFSVIVEAIKGLKGVRGRFELVDAGQDFPVIVDYAHTPDSLENVLNTCRGLTEGKLFVVVGCGGDRDKTKRPKMAKIAAELADEPVFTADNPRSEDPLAILRDMEEGVKGAYYHSIVNREQAIFFAIANAKKGDVVLIAGKGHETYQQIGGETFDFDDAEVAKRAVLELK